MKIKCLGSGSSGNCYLLYCNDEVLILDAGLPIMQIKKGLDFNLKGIQAALISHGHSDHVQSADSLKKMGIKVWQPYLDEQKIQRRYFGGFMVRSFDVPHDDVPCVGYLIECPNGERLLYATDFQYIKYSFKKMRIHHALIESNYCKELVDTEAENRTHVLRGHAEMRTTLSIIEDNKDSLQNVILCHLSSQNINSAEAMEEVKKVVNCHVYVAQKGLEVNLSQFPFWRE